MGHYTFMTVNLALTSAKLYISYIGSHEHHTLPNTAVYGSTVPSTGVVVK